MLAQALVKLKEPRLARILVAWVSEPLMAQSGVDLLQELCGTIGSQIPDPDLRAICSFPDKVNARYYKYYGGWELSETEKEWMADCSALKITASKELKRRELEAF